MGSFLGMGGGKEMLWSKRFVLAYTRRNGRYSWYKNEGGDTGEGGAREEGKGEQGETVEKEEKLGRQARKRKMQKDGKGKGRQD